MLLNVVADVTVKVDSFNGSVAPGECIIIKAGCDHSFTADAQARFIVADIDILPEHFMRSALLNFPISRPLKQYLSFVEVQLEQQVNSELDKANKHIEFLSELKDRRGMKEVGGLERTMKKSKEGNGDMMSPMFSKKLG